MIKFVAKGSFDKSIKFLHFLYTKDFSDKLDAYAQKGVEALAANTPVRTGTTAASWYYEVIKRPGRIVINWCNSNVNQGIPIAVLIQYGHGTGNGYYVQGQDYINPAIQPVFNDIAESIWNEVTNA